MNDDCDSMGGAAEAAAGADGEPDQWLVLEVVHNAGEWGPFDQFEAHARAAGRQVALQLQPHKGRYEVVLALSTDADVQVLNRDFRGFNKPTNVLSFPALEHPLDLADAGAGNANPEHPASDDDPMHLGDIILAEETLLREAREQGIAPFDHYTHLVVHGLLHLIGLDHETDDEAERMEALETRILATLGIADPYSEKEIVGPAG